MNNDDDDVLQAEQDSVVWVDIPTDGVFDDPNCSWKNVASFNTRAEAIAFAQKYFGADEEGRVSLVVGGN